MKKFFTWWKDLCVRGLHLPYAHNPVTGKPSITLLFPYITFTIAVGSVVWLHLDPRVILATGSSILFWVLSVVFYMLRSLHKAKIDINDQTIELDGGKK
jgi:hypothetical protein